MCVGCVLVRQKMRRYPRNRMSPVLPPLPSYYLRRSRQVLERWELFLLFLLLLLLCRGLQLFFSGQGQCCLLWFFPTHIFLLCWNLSSDPYLLNHSYLLPTHNSFQDWDPLLPDQISLWGGILRFWIRCLFQISYLSISLSYFIIHCHCRRYLNKVCSCFFHLRISFFSIRLLLLLYKFSAMCASQKKEVLELTPYFWNKLLLFVCRKKKENKISVCVQQGWMSAWCCVIYTLQLNSRPALTSRNKHACENDSTAHGEFFVVYIS